MDNYKGETDNDGAPTNANMQGGSATTSGRHSGREDLPQHQHHTGESPAETSNTSRGASDGLTGVAATAATVANSSRRPPSYNDLISSLVSVAQRAQELTRAYGQRQPIGNTARQMSVFGTASLANPTSSPIDRVSQAIKFACLLSQVANSQRQVSPVASVPTAASPATYPCNSLDQTAPETTAFQQPEGHSLLVPAIFSPQSSNTHRGSPVATSSSINANRGDTASASIQDRATSSAGAPNEATPEIQGTSTSPTPHRFTTNNILYSEQDEIELSPYQCLVRKQIELFEQSSNQAPDTSMSRGRKRPIVPGQVGIRCRHCAQLPPKSRTKYGILFPSSLVGLYQLAQNMAKTHLLETCKMIPADTREELMKRRSREKGQKTRKSAYGGGRDYWAASLRVLNVVETSDHRLRFSPPPAPSSHEEQQDAVPSPSSFTYTKHPYYN